MNEDKNLKLRKSNAVKAYETGTPEHKALLDKLWPGEFKPILITDRIKNFADVLEYHNITAERFAVRCEGDTDDEAAYKELKLVALALNELKEGEELDRDKTWYTPYFERRSGFGFSARVTITGLRLRLSVRAFPIKVLNWPCMQVKPLPVSMSGLCWSQL